VDDEAGVEETEFVTHNIFRDRLSSFESEA
jgi:hypothetical protein